MASRLSSLLVRDGLVGVKRMEKAFQRQVIYGGCLDTILLEIGMVDEERLIQYLSLATGLPPATREETNVFDPEAIKLCTLDIAREFRVAPLSFASGGALRVLVHDPVDLGQMEELANTLDCAIQPLVVPEYRFHIVFGRAFGGTPDARFVTLAKKSAETTPTPAVGKAPTVIVDTSATRAAAERAAADAADEADEADEEHVVVDVALPPSGKGAPAGRSSTLEFSTEALSRHLEETEARRKAAEARRATTADTLVAENEAEPEPAPDDGVPDEPADDAVTGEISGPSDGAPKRPMEGPETPLPGPVATASPRPPTAGGIEAEPLTVAEARELLQAVDERDLIFGTLLRAIRGTAWYAGLLTVQGGAAIGRVAIRGETVDREMITQVLIPLDSPSPFNNVVSGKSPYIGPIATGDDDIDHMIERLGGVVPPAALLLPIVLRNRVVAIAVGHRGGETIGVAEVAEILPLAGLAAEAISRLIMNRKAVGYRNVAGEAVDGVPEVSTDELPTKRIQRDAGAWKVPEDAAPAEVELGQEVSIEADEPDTIDEVLDACESDDEEIREQAMAEALRRADECLEALAARFPGKILVDRYEVGGRMLRAEQYGPLLDLVIRLGAASGDLLEQEMRDNRRDVRFYATLCASELRPRSVLLALVERLFDIDYGTRAAAIEALTGYPTRELDQGLVRVRQAIHSEDPERVQAAADAVAKLADIHAIPDLLDAVARNDKGTEHARRALVALTKQDFGTSTRKWRSWWQKNRRRSRVEWLMDGLSHKDEDIRRSAVEDLRMLTGEYFGYHHDLSKKERERGRKRWQQWWNESGRRRFLRQDPDERHRPTAVLPVKRD